MSRLPFVIHERARNFFEATVGARVVARASAWTDSDGDFTILNVVVREAYRRRGIATALYTAIEKAAGKPLVPAVSTSDDAFEFWKRFRPAAVAHDLRHRRDALMGASVVAHDRLATVIKVGAHNVTARFDDATESANSQACIGRSKVDAALQAAASLEVAQRAKQALSMLGELAGQAAEPTAARTVQTAGLPEDLVCLLSQFLEEGGAGFELPTQLPVRTLAIARFPDVELADGLTDERGIDYARDMVGCVTPPVVVIGDEWIDGRHRVWAAREDKAGTIEAIDLAGLIPPFRGIAKLQPANPEPVGVKPMAIAP